MGRRQIIPSMRTGACIWLSLGLASAILAQSAHNPISILGQRSDMRGQPAVVASLDPFARAYQGLDADQKAKFDALLAMSVTVPSARAARPFRRGGPQTSPTGPTRLTAAEHEILESLLTDGTLLRQASDGLTVLSHLASLAACSPADKRSTMSGSSLALDLIRMLRAEDLGAAMKSFDAPIQGPRPLGRPAKVGYPLPGGLGEITQCTVHFTCGAASMEVWLRLNQPAELVRIAHQLFCDGTSITRSSTLKPARNSQIYHAGDTIFKNERFRGDEGTEDRCDLDILLQSALMDKIALGNLSAYDVYADSGGIWNVMDGNSGGHPMYLEREMERLTGHPFAYAHNLNPLDLGGFARFFGNLRARTDQSALVDLAVAQCRAGKQVIICFQTKPSDAMALHYVTIAAYDHGSGTFYYVDTCETKSARSKLYKMTKQEMMDSLRSVIHPQ